MRPLFALAVALTLVGAGAAVAADPKKDFTPADQARARAMLLKKADVGLGFSTLPRANSGFQLNCAALDEGDLTLTGEANSPTFSSGLQTVSSASEVYVSVADANASWRRGTSQRGFSCLKGVLQRVARASGVRFVSFRKIPFPAVAPRVAAYRWQTLANGVRVYADVVVIMRSRAQAAALFISGIDPFDQAEEARLTRLIARRMASAMRSA